MRELWGFEDEFSGALERWMKKRREMRVLSLFWLLIRWVFSGLEFGVDPTT